MTFRNIVEKIKKDTWWSEESPGTYQQSLHAWRGFILQSNTHGPNHLSILLSIYQNDFLYEKTSEQEKLSQFYKVLKEFIKNPEIIDRYYKDFRKSRDTLIHFGDECMKFMQRINDEKLAKAYEEYYRIHTNFFTHGVLPECADVYTDKNLFSDMRWEIKENVSNKIVWDIAITLSIYPMLFFIEKERLEFLKLCLMEKPDFDEFSKKYHWIQNNYLKPVFLNRKYFEKVRLELTKNRTREEIKKEIQSLQNKPIDLKIKQTEYIRDIHFSNRILKIFELLRIFSRWIDERKFGALHGIDYVDSFMHEMRRRKKLSFEEISYYTPEEISALLRKDRRVSKNIITSRRKLSVYAIIRDTTTYKDFIYIGKQAEEILKVFTPKNTSLIQGFMASAPVKKFRGKVQIILNPHTQKFISGRILVTTMTRPDFIPLMRKASAIITDEGGITSHAAIVSRELGILCVIGTKIATKVLKDGDLVEVDAEKGVVRKI